MVKNCEFRKWGESGGVDSGVYGKEMSISKMG